MVLTSSISLEREAGAGALAPASEPERPKPQRSASERRLLYIVASPRPLTGKTFLARLAIEFLLHEGAAVAAFDLASQEGSLADGLPELTSRADVGNTRGQVALFDSLIAEDGVAKVVDVDHAQFKHFFACMAEIGLVEEARKRAIELVILFAADAHPASARAYAELQQRLGDAVLAPIFNEAVLKDRRLRGRFPSGSAAALPLQIPLLPPLLKREAERAGCSFADFPGRLPASISPIHAAELRSWAKRAFLELRELELRLLLDRLRRSLQA